MVFLGTDSFSLRIRLVVITGLHTQDTHISQSHLHVQATLSNTANVQTETVTQLNYRN